MSGKMKVTFVERDLGGKEIFGKIADAARWSVNTGFFQDSPTHPDAKMPLAELAAIHHHGHEAGNLPPRPFMKLTTQRELGAIKRASEKYAKFLVSTGSRSQAKDRMLLLGDTMAALMREQLMSGDGYPGLAESTIDRKERDGDRYPATPLVASMFLHDNIKSKVVRN